MRFFSTAILGLSAFASAGLVGAFVFPAAVPSTFKSCLPRPSPSHAQQLTKETVRRCDTSLDMGLKSFLKKSVLRRKKDDDSKDADDTKPSPAKAVQEKDVKEEVAESGGESTRYGQDHESVQDRINRLKSGDMTDEEKAAFLRTTLSASSETMSDDSKPLRQPIPSPDDPVSKRRKESASPFPKDSLLRNTFSRVPRKDAADSPVAIPTKPELGADRKKREYLEMVTNPDRFNAYVTPKTTEEPSSPIDSFISEEETVSPEDLVATENAPPKSSDDLGSRLEAAASAEEIRKREALRQQEDSKQKQQQNLAEMQRKRNEEIAKRESDALERKRKLEAAQRRAEEERRLAEEEQRQKMMAAQDAYWAQKLEEERKTQRKLLTDEEKEELAKQEARKREHKLHETEKEQERNRLREEERQREDPHESEILNEAEAEKLHDREEAWKVVDRSAARIKGTAPTPEVPDVGLSSFLRQQAEEKADIDAKKDAQLDQLKALNSPLPTPPPDTEPGVIPVMQQGRSVGSFSKAPSSKKPTEQPSRAKSVSEMMAELNNNEDEEDDKSKNGGGSSLGPFSRLLGKEKKVPDSKSSVSPQSSPEPNAPAAKKGPTRQQLPDPGKKSVVRQKLPMEDDDFDDFARNGPNKNMSVSDAMKKQGGGGSGKEDQAQRAKKWGIDISKFDVD